MIDRILKINGARFYEVWKAMPVKNPVTGSKGKKYSYFTQVYAVIQPTGTSGSVKGITLQDTQNAGDVKIADYFMFSKEERFEKERIFYKGKYYEIRSIEDYDNGYLKFYKSYLVKVDNQDNEQI